MKKRVILVSGMSGAGKTSATSVLEDMGYHCMENFPVQMLSALVDMIEHSTDPRYNQLVLSTSAMDFSEYLHVLSGGNLEVSVLFLDASNEQLLHRYKLTRRNHPLFSTGVCHTLEEAIEEERKMFYSAKDKVTYVIDTTFLKASDLKAKIQEYFSLSSKPVFTISFMSFGYKHGVPIDTDLLMDVRFMPNPYYIPELRPLTGRDPAVQEYVYETKECQEFIEKYMDLLHFLLPNYIKEGKTHLTVGIGCTGGQHRSIAIGIKIGQMLQAEGYPVNLRHRDN